MYKTGLDMLKRQKGKRHIIIKGGLGMKLKMCTRKQTVIPNLPVLVFKGL